MKTINIGIRSLIFAKTTWFLIAGVSLLVSSCSPVQFSSGTGVNGACNVNNPCTGPSGLLHVQQDFTFQTTNKVDVLIVDDNSGSMTVEQGNLASPLNGFIDNLTSSGLDWQVGVTTTDVCPASSNPLFCPSGSPGAQGTFIGPFGSSPDFGLNSYIITPGPNASNIFASTIQRNNDLGSGDERGIYALNEALDNMNSANAGFFRDSSNLAVIILSDENERSVGGDCQEIDPADPSQYNNFNLGQCDWGYAPLENNDFPQTFMNHLTTAFNGSKNVLVNSIIIKPDDQTLYPDPNQNNSPETCLNLQFHQPPDYTAHPGTVYQQLSLLANGKDSSGNIIGVGSICNNASGAFATMLKNINGLIEHLPTTNTITLNYLPADTPVLTCVSASTGAPLNTSFCASSNWTISSNQITFTNRPPDGTTVNVAYDYNAAAQAASHVTADPRKMEINIFTPDLYNYINLPHD